MVMHSGLFVVVMYLYPDAEALLLASHAASLSIGSEQRQLFSFARGTARAH